jgi:hypothetical protein
MKSFFMLLMVSGRSLQSKKDNSSRIRKKFFPDPGGKKAPDTGFARLTDTIP